MLVLKTESEVGGKHEREKKKKKRRVYPRWAANVDATIFQSSHITPRATGTRRYALLGTQK